MDKTHTPYQEPDENADVYGNCLEELAENTDQKGERTTRIRDRPIHLEPILKILAQACFKLKIGVGLYTSQRILNHQDQRSAFLP